VRRPADGDDVGNAVAIDVAIPEILSGDVAIDYGPQAK